MEEKNVRPITGLETPIAPPEPSTPMAYDDSIEDHQIPRDGPARVWCYDEPDM
jgi:hypothetical protein